MTDDAQGVEGVAHVASEIGEEHLIAALGPLHQHGGADSEEDPVPRAVPIEAPALVPRQVADTGGQQPLVVTADKVGLRGSSLVARRSSGRRFPPMK